MNVTDLDIHNYSYPELLQLFNIPSIEKHNLKRAYKTTMMTHPDQSGLDKEYFLFFVKAYRILHNIANQGNRKRETNIDMRIDDNIIRDFISSPDFNSRFNQQFEALDIQDEDQQSGYEDWFRNKEETSISTKPANVRDMNTLMEQERDKQIDCYGKIQSNAIISIGENSSYDLLRKRTPHYDSDIFSSLPYQDLKKAHEETLIRVRQIDGIKHTHMNIEEYKKKRNDIPITFNTSTFENTEEQIQFSFEMAKQEEEEKRTHKSWWSSFQQITNS